MLRIRAEQGAFRNVPMLDALAEASVAPLQLRRMHARALSLRKRAVWWRDSTGLDESYSRCTVAGGEQVSARTHVRCAWACWIFFFLPPNQWLAVQRAGSATLRCIVSSAGRVGSPSS